MSQPDVTRLLRSATSGDADAASQLADVVYADLRRLAASLMQGERAGHTLQPTAVVNEAYMQLMRLGRMEWQDRAHFFAMAATQMRRLLVDHARKRRAERRGGGAPTLSLDEGLGLSVENDTDVLALHEALEALEAEYPRPARVMVMRFFGGMTVPEVAAVLDVSQRTVEGDSALARAWLRRALTSAER